MKDFETVSDYLDAAKTCLGLSTDRALLPVLGITKNYLSELRTGEKFPSPPLMIKIANLALKDAEQALMLLDILTAKTEQERIVRQRIKKKLDLRWYAGAILLLCSPLTFLSDYGLQTTTDLAQSANINCATFRHFVRRLIFKIRSYMKPAFLRAFLPSTPVSSALVLS